jgi:hypothetical protein
MPARRGLLRCSYAGREMHSLWAAGSLSEFQGRFDLI